MGHPWSFYVKIMVPCFLVGAGVELFMIHTNFYEKVTAIEASRLEEGREEREQKHKEFWGEVTKQMKEKNLPVPQQLKEFDEPYR